MAAQDAATRGQRVAGGVLIVSSIVIALEMTLLSDFAVAIRIVAVIFDVVIGVALVTGHGRFATWALVRVIAWPSAARWPRPQDATATRLDLSRPRRCMTAGCSISHEPDVCSPPFRAAPRRRWSRGWPRRRRSQPPPGAAGAARAEPACRRVDRSHQLELKL